MKKIPLGNHKKGTKLRGYALVDDEDFEYLNQWNWWLDSQGYAVRDIGGRKNKERVLMHRVVNNTPDGFFTDHVNRNKLDNRKSNLRTATPSQNGHNSKLSKNNKSGYNGVEWYKNRWVSRIKVNYKNIYLGRYERLEDAILARKKGEKEYAV